MQGESLGGVTLQALPADPRDVTAVVDEPTFRVDFWRDRGGLRCREFEVRGGDVSDVVVWAEHAKEDGETYVLGVLTQMVGANGAETVLTHLMGTDPSR